MDEPDAKERAAEFKIILIIGIAIILVGMFSVGYLAPEEWRPLMPISDLAPNG